MERGVTPCQIEVELGLVPTKRVEVGVELAGYRPKLSAVNLTRGQLAVVEMSLEKLPDSGLRKEPEPGQIKVNPQDAAELVYVPGEFTMGWDDNEAQQVFQEALDFKKANNLDRFIPQLSWYRDVTPQRRVYLNGFWMYKHEVTVAQYRNFCNATARQMPTAPAWGWKDNNPIVNVSWERCQATADWAGVRLPTRLSGKKQRAAAMGDVMYGAARGLHRTRSVTFQIARPRANSRIGWWFLYYDDGWAETAPVGSFPLGASPYGCLDMTGNVWERCADWVRTL